MVNQKTFEIIDNFTQQTIEMVTEALAEKDKVIKELQAKLANCTCSEVAHE